MDRRKNSEIVSVDYEKRGQAAPGHHVLASLVHPCPSFILLKTKRIKPP